MPLFSTTTTPAKTASSISTSTSSPSIARFKDCLENIDTLFDWRRPARNLFKQYDSGYTVPADKYEWTPFDEHFQSCFARLVFSRGQRIQTPQLWTEDLIQCFVMAYSRQMLAPFKADVCYTTSNESRYKQKGVMPLHHDGLFSGLSDIVVPLPAGGFGALFLELKRDRSQNTQVSRKQVLFGQQIASVGNLYVIAWGVQDAILVLDAYIRLWLKTRLPPPDFHEHVPDNLRHAIANNAAFSDWLTRSSSPKRQIEIVDATSKRHKT